MPFRQEAIVRPDAPLQVDIALASDSQFYAGLSGEVVGVFASTFLVFPPDTPVELIVSFADGRQFRAWGSVHFVRAAAEDQLPGLGVRFTKIADTDVAAVNMFAQHRPPMFYDAD